MPMSLYAQAKAQAAAHIAVGVELHGHAATGVAIEAVLEACGEYLNRHHGAVNAFGVFTRAAERAIAPRLAQIPPTPRADL
jgi:hypothetical protein